MKVKTHRGDPLNEGSDDLGEVGHTLEREGENYRSKQWTTRLVFSYYDRNSSQWKKDRWSRTIRNTAKRGVVESLLVDRMQFGANKCRKGLFEGHVEDREEDRIQLEQSWRATAPDK